MFTRSFRLGLERLDDRNAPSSLFGNAVATTDWMPPSDTGSEYDTKPIGNKPPKIVNFVVSVGTGNFGTFSGTVQDENPAGLTVHITGSQTCLQPNGVFVTTDMNGNFTFGGQLYAGDSGIVSAVTADAEGLTSNTATYNLIV